METEGEYDHEGEIAVAAVYLSKEDIKQLIEQLDNMIGVVIP